jgi:hypothetical protein
MWCLDARNVDDLDTQLHVLEEAFSRLEELAPEQHSFYLTNNWRFMLGSPHVGTKSEAALHVTMIGNRVTSNPTLR